MCRSIFRVLFEDYNAYVLYVLRLDRGTEVLIIALYDILLSRTRWTEGKEKVGRNI